jgi:plasmid stability protein
LEAIMPNLSIKDVPDALAEKLRQRAARNHRSLQGELLAMLEASTKGQNEGQNTLLAQEPLPVRYAAEPGRSAIAGAPDDLLAQLEAIAVANRRGDSTATDRSQRQQRLREIAAGANSGFSAAARLTREDAHDRALLRRLGV